MEFQAIQTMDSSSPYNVANALDANGALPVDEDYEQIKQDFEQASGLDFKEADLDRIERSFLTGNGPEYDFEH